MSTSLSFNEVSFTPVPVHNNDSIWLRAADIARALGYQREDKVSRLYQRNADEFTPDMTQVIEILDNPNSGVSKNLTTTARIFSLRGCHLLAMFSRTPVAKAFRKWVLDVLDRMAEEERAALPHGDKLSAAEQSHLHAIVSAKAGMLPADMQRKAFAEMWTRFNRHFRIARYAQLPPAKMGEAVEYLVSMEVRAAQKALPQSNSEMAAASSLATYLEQQAATSPIPVRMLDQFPKDMGTGRREALKKIEAILKQFYGLRDTVRLFTSPGGYSTGRSLSEKEQYDILLNLYRAADANLAAAYNALEAGYRMGREIGRG